MNYFNFKKFIEYLIFIVKNDLYRNIYYLFYNKNLLIIITLINILK